MIESSKKKIREVKIPKKYEASYIISDNIERITNLMSSKVFEDITYQTSITKSFTNQPIQSPLIFILNQFISLVYSKEISISILNIELPFDILVNLLFKTNTIDNTTLFTIILNLKNLRFQKHNYLNKIIKGCKKLCVEYIQLLENYLKKNNEFLYQYESIIINSSKDKVWDIITNIDIVQKLHKITINDCSDKSNCKGEKIYEINAIQLQKKIYIKIDKIKYDKNKSKYELHIYPINIDFPSQEIIFELISLPENQTFLSITHIFNENVTFDEIKYAERKKKYVLQLFKNFLEGKKENNNKDEKENEEEEETEENERECKSDFDININNNNININRNYYFESTDFPSLFCELAKNLSVSKVSEFSH